ncbi:hypothetical protein [Streptosporangium sp. NPDC023615]|uniref:hypothetical protein n=1 Tax=Streptosporangium sp. NPDC023615 TaxID=3154794 RepID=UPI003419FF75
MIRCSSASWAASILLSAVVPYAAMFPTGMDVDLCVHRVGPDPAPLGLSFAAMATALPLVLVALALAARGRTTRRRRLSGVGAVAALATGACHLLSRALFSPYCPEGSLPAWFVVAPYGAVAVLLLLSGAGRRHTGTA